MDIKYVGQFLLLVGASFPILVSVYFYVRKGKLMTPSYFIISVISIVLAVLLISYGPHLYKDLRLLWLGVDLEGLSDAIRNKSVLPHNVEEATRLYGSLMGIGWPLQAMFLLVYVAIPFLILVVFVSLAVEHFLKRGESCKS